MDEKSCLLFDIGGTKMRVATSDGAALNEVKRWDTPEQFDDIFSFLSEYKDNSFDVVVVAVAGVLDKEKSKLVHSPNLQHWINVPIKQKLGDFFGTKILVENDAALAGLGESCHGAGRGKKIVAYLTVSTGVGGARIVDKKIDQRLWGFEPGSQIVDADTSVWAESVDLVPPSFTKGSIESYISGAALKSRFGKPASEIKDEKIWKDVEKLLAVSLNNTISYWSPEVIVLGGGLVLEEAIDLGRVKDKLSGMFYAFPEIPEMKVAELKDESALYGCLSFIGRA